MIKTATSDTFSRQVSRLTDWFSSTRRSLPWREESADSVNRVAEPIEAMSQSEGAPQPLSLTRRDPYRTWISEIMLQQTQVVTVIDYFERWMLRFPDLASLAAAEEEEVLKSWAGLGYYSRGRNLLATARLLVSSYGGRFPSTRKELLALPGIGDYTAGAILSLAFNLPEPILDGNLIRVFSRFHQIPFLPGSKEGKRVYWARAREWVIAGEPAKVNEGLMELGALVCLPRNPKCEACPLSSRCLAFEKNLQSKLPPPKPRPEARKWRGYALIVVWKNQVLLRIPRKPEWLAGLPSFPLIQATGSDELEKRCREGFVDWPLLRLSPSGIVIRHGIMHSQLSVEICRVEFPAKKKQPKMGEGYFWVSEADIPAASVSSLTRKIWSQIGMSTFADRA